MTIPGGFVAGDILGAADLNALPAGKMGYASITAAQNAIESVTDVTSLTVTWTAVASRLYRTSFMLHVDVNWVSGASRPQILIADGVDTTKQTVQLTAYTATATAVFMSGYVLETSLSGSTTRKLRALHNGDNGTIDIVASSTQPAFILVEDIGAA